MGNVPDDRPALLGLGDEEVAVARGSAWTVVTDELLRLIVEGGKGLEVEMGVEVPDSRRGVGGGEATFCWSIVDAAKATVLGFAEEDVVFVATVVADVVGTVGRVDEPPNFGLALGFVVALAPVADVLRLPLFPLPFPPDDDCKRFKPCPRPLTPPPLFPPAAVDLLILPEPTLSAVTTLKLCL